MSPTTAPPDLAAVRAAVAAVPDPELPPVTIGMLGMIHAVAVGDDGRVTVELLPTFTGCPATDMIGRDVDEAVRAVPGVRSVEVRFRFDPPWTSGRITGEGRKALVSFGIAPPAGVVEAAEGADVPGRRRLPLLTAAPPAACPYCQSVDTVRDSLFGPTPCRAVHYCNTCRQPFEAFKDL